MQGRNLILIGIAVFIGLVAVFIANIYFSGVERRQVRIADQQQLQRIVVANQELAFGTPLNGQNLRVASWPASSVPAGAFTSLEAATRGGRVALRPIVPGEPVLASKVSGGDVRATLSANLPIGQLAYAIPINDVAGVAGFVRPGDRVDVLLTRQMPGEGAGGNDKMADVVLEAVPVLGIDQNSNESDTKPATGRTATLQVDTFSAQKLALATQLGTLSLALRNVADQQIGPRQTVVPRHLTVAGFFVPQRAAAAAPAPRLAMAAPAAAPAPAAAVRGPRAALALPRPRGPSMTVYRGVQSSEYEVMSGR